MKIWQPVTVKKNQCLEIHLGGLCVWVCNAGDEWHVGHEYLAGQMIPARTGQIKQQPDGKSWQRWTKEPADDIIRLKPVMPDRAVVVKSGSPLTIPMKSSTRFFIGIPLWLQVTAGKKGEAVMLEKPVMQLSNTWFGDMESGELCYYLESAVSQSVDFKAPFTGKVICPVQVANQSKESLEMATLRVDVKYLSIFAGRERLWSNGLKVTQPEGRNYSQVEVKKNPPQVNGAIKRMSDSREVHKTGLLKSTFSGLMQITNIWSG